jgi:peptide-methionine (R)-S-oxide reductase
MARRALGRRLLLAALLAAGGGVLASQGLEAEEAQTEAMKPIQKSDEEWRRQLSPEQYHVMREQGTERPFTGEYWNHHGDGVYRCAACGVELYRSDAKFDSGTGWPSFQQAVADGNIRLVPDDSHGMHRTEIRCARCGAHLGHLFDDGPGPGGQRHCVNSCALKFAPRSAAPPPAAGGP